MKRILMAIAFAGLTGAPLAAQAEPPAPGESPQELQAKLGKLMKEASEEMAALERELARASLSSPKADVIAERIKQIREAMEQGKLEDLPEGLRDEIKQNPDEVAKLTGKTNEEVTKLAESSDTLRDLLKQNPEVLKKLAASEEVMQRVLEKQNAVEKRLAETLQKTEESAEAARKNVDESIKVAHELKAASQGSGSGEGQPKNKGESTSDKGDKDQKQGGNGKSQQGANSQYQPGEGAGPRDDKTEEFERAAKTDGFQGEKKNKEAEAGSSNDDNRREPGRYSGFSKKWNEEVRKRTEERKDEGK